MPLTFLTWNRSALGIVSTEKNAVAFEKLKFSAVWFGKDVVNVRQ